MDIHEPNFDKPFTKNMDEIQYWVETKQAPCLFRYDGLYVIRPHETHSSQIKVVDSKPQRKESFNPSPIPKRKKKRKLSILDSSDVEKKDDNVFFINAAHTSKQPTVLSSYKDSIISDTDVNLNKSLNTKGHKVHSEDRRKSVQKRLKMVSSTPKVSIGSKRSLHHIEKTQQLESSLESGLFSGETKIKQSSVSKTVSKNSTEHLATNHSRLPAELPHNVEHEKANGVLEDSSDVSGFTANYIRSTKRSSKVRNISGPKKRGKRGADTSKTDLILEKTRNHRSLVCLNKSVNTGQIVDNPLNCSNDSCQILNFVSTDNRKPKAPYRKRLNKGTSLLKFIEPSPKKKESPRLNKTVSFEKVIDQSFESNSSATPRYLTRSKVNSLDNLSIFQADSSSPVKIHSKLSEGDSFTITNTLKTSKHSDTKPILPKSKRKQKSLFVLDSSTGPTSTTMSVNVANFGSKIRQGIVLKDSEHSTIMSKDKSVSSAGRERSGFTACFTDSEDDHPQRKQKYFKLPIK